MERVDGNVKGQKQDRNSFETVLSGVEFKGGEQLDKAS